MVDEILNSDADPTIKELLKHLTRTIEKLQATIEKQTALIEQKDAELSELRRALFGRRSEKMPPMAREVKKVRRTKENIEADKQKTQAKRKDNAKKKRTLPTEEIHHEVDPSDCRCPHCGGTEYAAIGNGETSEEYEYVAAKFIRRVHIRQKLACRCGGHVITAPAPVRVSEGVKYGPAFHAQVAVAKCADSIPLHRQARQLTRTGIPMCTSTVCDIFHRDASLLEPISKRIFEKIHQSDYVNADETRIGVQDGTRAYVWNFSTDKYVGYIFNQSRSGDTPNEILGDSAGYLQVDQYSGYNQVTTPGKRRRVGCFAHMRRKFFEAKDAAPRECEWIMNRVRDLYAVEYDAAELNALGSGPHLAMRKARSKPILNDMKKWLDENHARWTPKSKMGKAVFYALNNWSTMEKFLEDPRLMLDNNLAERALRIIALGRKNFLFVGNEQAGKNLAILQTLISTCNYLKINPQEYLEDVLIRIQTHPATEIDDLLPDQWTQPDRSPD